jgi:hypothetical protein
MTYQNISTFSNRGSNHYLPFERELRTHNRGNTETILTKLKLISKDNSNPKPFNKPIYKYIYQNSQHSFTKKTTITKAYLAVD